VARVTSEYLAAAIPLNGLKDPGGMAEDMTDSVHQLVLDDVGAW
jgi:hypothetical protein